MFHLVEAAKRIQPLLIEWRRHLHQHPEIGAEVPETAAFVAERLREMGLTVREKVGGFGVVGLLEGSYSGPTLAIRADMDALPITEETGLPFASKHPGRMHACGHDGHTAILLGTAKILAAHRDGLKGKVKFIFQPAEEGPGGAKPMIEDGALSNPPVDAIIGLHLGVIWDLPPGTVGVRPGSMMASTDRFEIRIKGKGGHGAMPHQTVDAVVVGAQVVTALQTIVSRRVDPLEPVVVTVGSLHAGSTFNVIADTAVLKGTVRCFQEALREKIRREIEMIARGVAAGMGAEATVDYLPGHPPLINDPNFTDFFVGVARDILGEKRVVTLPYPTMGGEDMSYFLNAVPGTYFFLASGNPAKGIVYPHHHPKFDIDEDVLWLGTALFAETAWRWLGNAAQFSPGPEPAGD